ncbi:MAG: hypothetical protein HOP28_04950 [Gemmatimonadales bacterium]|nr:hypothetical protein [Gemmatimonadales bacterium]
MIMFRVLGGVDLRTGDGREIRQLLQQPKRLALLVYLLLASPGRYLRRDTLLGLFWPELDEEHARAALRRALYFLRQALGPQVVETRGDDEVSIAPGAISIDALEFQEAARTGDTSRMHELYQGPLLEGLYVAGAPDAEAWLDRERTRLAALFERLGETPVSREPRALPAAPGGGRLLLICPFTVRGDPSLAYLAEGMVDLLTTKLDGAGDLRVVEPRLALGAVAAGEWNEARGRALAERSGAGLFALGSVVSAAGRIEARITIHGRNGPAESRAEARAESEAGLFELVDELARKIVAEEEERRGDRLAGLAARTTDSLPALKSWLAGERAFRLASYFEAGDAFRRATEADPSFALAWYRLAAALAASALMEPAREASAQAHRFRLRLSEHDRLLLEAQHAWIRGESDEAERLYAALVTAWPESLEGWFLLGDVLFHSNPYHGRSIAQARVPFERALALDPSHVGAVVQLARIAALEGRIGDLDALVERAITLSPAGDQALVLRALRAFRGGRMAEQGAITKQLTEARGLTIARAFSDVALYGGNLDDAARFARDLFAAARSAEFKAFGLVILAHLDLARGREALAFERLAEVEGLDPTFALETGALFATFPFLTEGAGRVAAARERLDRWDPGTARQAMAIPLAFHNDLHHQFRAYLRGVLAVRAGDLTAAALEMESLAELPIPQWAEALLQHLTRTLQAELLRARGELPAALATLEDARSDIWFQYAVASPFFAGAAERFLRAELLMEAGRIPEAIRWLDAIAQRSPFELPFLAPARRLREEGWRRLGTG